jgi:hypothetical protein
MLQHYDMKHGEFSCQGNDYQHSLLQRRVKTNVFPFEELETFHPIGVHFQETPPPLHALTNHPDGLPILTPDNRKQQQEDWATPDEQRTGQQDLPYWCPVQD